jgi:hypothetical protein
MPARFAAVLAVVAVSWPVRAEDAPPAPPSEIAADGGAPAASTAPSTPDAGLPPCACTEAKPPQLDHSVEISFGTVQLFNDASKVTEPGTRILPTAAALLLGEWLLGESFAVAAFVNLPLSEAKFLDQATGTIKYQAADPVAAVGVRWSPVRVDVLKRKARFEVQLAGFVGSTLFSVNPAGNTLVPVVSGRLHLHDNQGLALYVGTSWAFVRESLVLTYGLGYRF